MSFPYKWYLKNGYPAPGVEAHNCSVFGTFICGGGSTMGYKLAGFHHLGGVELDPQVAKIYNQNHRPEHLYNQDIREFNEREDLPATLYDLDLLDGSPPCSSFSLAGNREKDWGKQKVFREGQKNQRLDDLVFTYVETIKKLQPKVAILENVKGLLVGNAKPYAKKILQEFTAAGYRVQTFLLNASAMGVPQRRERVFFIGLRNDIDLPRLTLEFNERPIFFGQCRSPKGDKPSDLAASLLARATKKDKRFSDVNMRVYGKVSQFNSEITHDNRIKGTITSQAYDYRFFDRTKLNKYDYSVCGSYPLDYDFMEITPKYLIGMSVPPVMTAQISNQIFLQWLKPLQGK